MAWQHIATHIPVNRPEYRWELDEYRNDADEQMMFAHLTVFKLTPSLIKQMLATWRLFREHVQCPLFAIGEVDDDKWSRFVSLFGFKFLMEVVCENGQHRRMFISHGTPNAY
jgi:hypothetical protein